jgi:hypothetical protein
MATDLMFMMVGVADGWIENRRNREGMKSGRRLKRVLRRQTVVF